MCVCVRTYVCLRIKSGLALYQIHDSGCPWEKRNRDRKGSINVRFKEVPEKIWLSWLMGSRAFVILTYGLPLTFCNKKIPCNIS